MNFSKMPHFTSYQEAAFQNYKFAFSLNKETEEHRYWEENGLFCADSMLSLIHIYIDTALGLTFSVLTILLSFLSAIS